MKNFQEHIISNTTSTKIALQRLTNLGTDLTLFIINKKGELLGSLTDGDVRRGLIKGFDIQMDVEIFMNLNVKYIFTNNYNLHEIRAYKNIGITLLPIVTEKKVILDIINLKIQETKLPISAVIMAGGEGQRLRPLTETVPKSLLKVGSKPILEHVIDKLAHFGINKITICINYLGHQIIEYFKDGNSKNILIDYINEEKKLGTAGAVSRISEPENDTVLLMNADLLTNINFEDFFLQFQNLKSDIMVASIPYSVKIPYAVFDIEENQIISINEKPTLTYYSNAGIYLINKKVLKYIPKDKFYDATDLIEDLIKQGKKVNYYPIHGFWLDIGSHDDYIKANKYIEQNEI